MELEKKLAMAEAKLGETKEELVNLKDELIEIHKRKAELMADLVIEENVEKKAELAKVSKVMSKLKSDIGIFPDVINILSSKVEKIKAEIDQKNAVIAQKRKAKEEKELISLCREFYESLKETNLLNNKLKEMENIFKAKWGNLPGGKNFTIGSDDSLKALWETIEKEFKGEGRKPILFGNLPNFRI